MPDRIFLTVDLDFWASWQVNKAERFFLDLSMRNIPIAFEDHHHHLLWMMNLYDYDTLINMDYHSDIADGHRFGKEMTSPDEAVWTHFIRNSNHKKYIWIYPCGKCLIPKEHDTKDATGFCHDKFNPFEAKDFVKACGWKHIEYKSKSYKIDWPNVVAVGVCRSEEYLGSDLLSATYYKWKHVIEKKMTAQTKERLRHVKKGELPW